MDVKCARVSSNIILELSPPFFLITEHGRTVLPWRITDYVLETKPSKLQVTKEELGEAIINSWLLVRLHCRKGPDIKLCPLE